MYFEYVSFLNPVALRKAKIVCNFGLSECIRVKTFVNNADLYVKISCQSIMFHHGFIMVYFLK